MLFYALSNFESQISSYKQDKAVRFFCFVNKARVLFCSRMCSIGISFNLMLLFFNFDKFFMNTLNQLLFTRNILPNK